MWYEDQQDLNITLSSCPSMQHIYLSFILTVYSLYDMKSEMLSTKECVYASVHGRGRFPELNEAGISSVTAMQGSEL